MGQVCEGPKVVLSGVVLVLRCLERVVRVKVRSGRERERRRGRKGDSRCDERFHCPNNAAACRQQLVDPD